MTAAALSAKTYRSDPSHESFPSKDRKGDRVIPVTEKETRIFSGLSAFSFDEPVIEVPQDVINPMQHTNNGTAGHGVLYDIWQFPMIGVCEESDHFIRMVSYCVLTPVSRLCQVIF